MRVLLVLVLVTHLPAATPPPGSDRYDDSNEHVFLPDEVTTVLVQMDATDLSFLLQFSNRYNREYKPATVRVMNSRVDETVANVGIRLRGNTSREAQKKSWKLSFNEFVPGRRFHGTKKFNLNGEHNDVSITRSRLSWDLYRSFGVPAARTTHVHFVINDGSRVDGLFVNVEQIDDDFLDAWFGNDEGNLYKCTYKGQRADLKFVSPGEPSTYRNRGGGPTGSTYDLESDENPTAFVDLADFIAFVNNSSNTNFRNGLIDRFSVDTFLRAMAADVVMGHWDNYWFGANNYYLYHHPETGRLEYIPFDVDNTWGTDFFGIDWARRSHASFGDGGFGSSPGLPPLIPRLLAVDAWEKQYLRYVRRIACALPELTDASLCKLDSIRAELPTLRSRLAPFAYLGTYSNATMDHSFSNADFQQSYTLPTSYSSFQNPWAWGLEPFIDTRRQFIADTVPSPSALPKLSVNEVLLLNSTTLADEAGEFDAWFEIHNGGDTPAAVGGLYVSDDPFQPRRWQIPANTEIPAGGHLLIWADGEEAEGPLHTSFELSFQGGTLAIFESDANGNVFVDMLSFPGTLIADRSFGRFPDGDLALQSFETVTPGAANDDSLEPLTGPFLRADANGDGAINIADPSFVANFVFGVAPATPPPCEAAADANADGAVNIADPSFIANFVFGVGAAHPPEAPFPDCGTVQDEVLSCEDTSACLSPEN